MMFQFHRSIDGKRNFVFDFALSKLYSNCLLATLNARASIQASTKSSTDSARLNPMVLPSRREGMPPTKQSAYPHEIDLTATALYGIDSKPLEVEQSTDADYGIMIKGSPKILRCEAVLLTFTEMGDSVELGPFPRKGA
jgi:hypothetical protein